MDRSSVNEVMDNIKRKVKEEDLSDRAFFSPHPLNNRAATTDSFHCFLYSGNADADGQDQLNQG